MNNSISINSVKHFIDDIKNPKEITFDDITWKIQESKKNSVLFIQTTDGYKIFEKYFKEPIDSTVTIVTNNKELFEKLDDNTVVLSMNEKFLEIRKSFCDEIYKISKEQKLICVTGTNGKTSVSNYIVQICELNKLKAVTVGTLGVFNGSRYQEGYGLTSPDYIDIRKFLNNNTDKDVVVFETSSHALEQKRFHKIGFNIGAWTNFTQDHLDYHGTMQAYFDAKLKITELVNGNMLLLSDDMKDYFEKINYRNKKLVITENFFDNEIKNKNLSLAIKVFYYLFNKIFKDYKAIKDIPGRFNFFKGLRNDFVLDFAHTPDALENLLFQIKKIYNKKLITVFGCGGDRDRSKRKLMGIIANKYSDIIILTNDNPRNEDPFQIIKDIAVDIQVECYKIPNRVEAIKKANEFLGSIIIVAGKGHENYIEINNVKYPYSDEEEIKKYL